MYAYEYHVYIYFELSWSLAIFCRNILQDKMLNGRQPWALKAFFFLFGKYVIKLHYTFSEHLKYSF